MVYDDDGSFVTLLMYFKACITSIYAEEFVHSSQNNVINCNNRIFHPKDTCFLLASLCKSG